MYVSESSSDFADHQAFRYCQGDGIIYLKGNSDKLANMDIDCDGVKNSLCPAEGTDTQYQTSFKDTVNLYGIPDLDASIHNYVVFGNAGNKAGYTTFDPKAHGVQPLSLMAVVCNNQLVSLKDCCMYAR